jgi:hypothetical protein
VPSIVTSGSIRVGAFGTNSITGIGTTRAAQAITAALAA